MGFRDSLTIDEAVQKLQSNYQDLSVSKLRFLEDEGLIAPERTEGGYRKYSREDVGRIELILRLQREKFLPLAVIKVKLDEYDQGLTAPEVAETLELFAREDTKKNDAGKTRTTAAPVSTPAPNKELYAIELEPAERVALVDLVREEQIPEQFILELRKYGIIEVANVAGAPRISRSDVACVRAAWSLRGYGIEPRHVRMYATFADKEALTFEQFLRPTYRHKTPRSKETLAEVLSDISEQTEILKRRLLQRALVDKLGDLL